MTTTDQTSRNQRISGAGICPVCQRETGNVASHLKRCRQDHELTDAEKAWMERSTAHARSSVSRPEQHFQCSVTHLEVARVMYALEAGIKLRRGKYRWAAPTGHPVARGNRLTIVVEEMIRTGLVRDYRDPRTDEHHLIPALVHYGINGQSACLATGEDRGPMRTRIIDRLDLVDCLECERVVATGQHRSGLDRG